MSRARQVAKQPLTLVIEGKLKFFGGVFLVVFFPFVCGSLCCPLALSSCVFCVFSVSLWWLPPLGFPLVWSVALCGRGFSPWCLPPRVVGVVGVSCCGFSSHWSGRLFLGVCFPPCLQRGGEPIMKRKQYKYERDCAYPLSVFVCAVYGYTDISDAPKSEQEEIFAQYQIHCVRHNFAYESPSYYGLRGLFG